MSVNLFPKVLKDIRLNVLKWYDDNQRSLPWRAKRGEVPNPYYVYLSEIMLQQTTVATVKDYFERFIKKWPTLTSLANASLDEILVEWQGLGYYSRARNLHKAVKILNELSLFPSTPTDLRKLPGVGDYTAAAIASIAFGYLIVPIDGNIMRVFARLFAIPSPVPLLKQKVYEYTSKMAEGGRSGDFAQGLMDLGAMICRPLNPKCTECPLRVECRAHNEGRMAVFPVLRVKPQIPKRYGIAYILLHDGKILLEKRPTKGLLGGMMGVPTTPWEGESLNSEDLFEFEKDLKWHEVAKQVKHTFTHFHLYLTVKVGISPKLYKGDWIDLDHLPGVALPTVMKKVIKQIPTEILRNFSKIN
ncbi:MAG: A/G-specific adenine glycosylase [Alphaproteobacteria bacterium]|nr:A/G-specific adenine glycosylase [Alphaproteobacteria bacterium]